MTEDARFEDGQDKPLRLHAVDTDDVQAISALVQDAVLVAKDITWRPKDRRFAMLINRFRWEDVQNAAVRSRPFERVQSVLVFEDVMQVRSQGVDRGDQDTILSLLSITYQAHKGASDQIHLTFAGDGTIMLEVEAIAAQLRDVTRPYIAPSKSIPNHPD